MDHHFALHQNIRQDQRLVMNMAMQRAFDVLQMPIHELSDWLEREIEQNPLLEISSSRDKSHSCLETTIANTPSRHTYLQEAIRDHFETEEEQAIAEYIAGSLDDKGFLTLSKEESYHSDEAFKCVLHAFQRMEPVGLGARDVQEALLIQLEVKGKKNSTIYHIVKEHYNDLLHSRYRAITKLFRLTLGELKRMIQTQLRPLNPFPGQLFTTMHNPAITPDIRVEKVGENWKVEVCEGDLPSFHIHESYLETHNLKREDRDYIRRHVAAGKWLYRILDRRKETLQQIMLCIVKKQTDFLEGIAQAPHPMTMSEIASALQKSESTVTRTIANKYVDSPLGLISMRSFFTQPIHTQEGAVSNKRAKDLLVKLIEQEDSPLSDESLSLLLKAQGIPCARRTVTKYRKQLKILSAAERKLWK